MKRKKSIKKRSYEPINAIYNNNKSQMITFMGVLLVISVVALTAFTADLANINALIPIEHSSSLWIEFINVKQDFGESFKYNFYNVSVWEDNGDAFVLFKGNTTYPEYNIYKAFNETYDSFYLFELQHGIIFDAEILPDSILYNTFSDGYIYTVDVNLSLKDGKTHVFEDVKYNLKFYPNSYNFDFSSSGGGSTPTEVLDQSWGDANYNFDISTGDSGKYWYAQSFIPTVENLTKIRLYLKKTGAPPDLFVCVCTNTSGEPDVGNRIYIESIDESNLDTTYNWIEFDVPGTGVGLVPGNTYYIFIYTTDGKTGFTEYSWGCDSSGVYTDGTLWRSMDSGVSWTKISSYDTIFETYGTSG